ncbi:MAG TPA: hypothetical protein DCF62_11570 [Porticoccaceae bacterium]|nr:hypothetical protein [Porticoccaceae bacterium]HCO59052.1 hypothetical protein [Porticoccaceae bacterium]
MNDPYNDEINPGDTESSARPNKSAQKRQMRDLQATGEKLLGLPKTRLSELPLPDDLIKALAEGRRLKHADAIRRQIRFIAKLIKNADHENILAALNTQEEGERLFRQRFQQVEALGERLGTGDQDLLEQVLAEHPQLERQRIRQLIRLVQKENKDRASGEDSPLTSLNASDQAATIRNQPSTAQRKLFDYLRENMSA